MYIVDIWRRHHLNWTPMSLVPAPSHPPPQSQTPITLIPASSSPPPLLSTLPASPLRIGDSNVDCGTNDLAWSDTPQHNAMPPAPTPQAVPASTSPSPPRYIPPALRKKQDRHLNKDENVPFQENTRNPKKDELETNRKKRPDIQSLLWPFDLGRDITFQPGTWRLIKSASRGLQKGKNPIRSRPSGGTYYMQKGSGDKMAGIFKPEDEEANAVHSARGLKKGTKVGKAASVEVAISLLDHSMSRPWVDDDMKNGMPVTIEFLYRGPLRKIVVDGDMKNDFSASGVTLMFLNKDKLRKVVDGDMKKGSSANGMPLKIGIFYKGAFRKVIDGNMRNDFFKNRLAIKLHYEGEMREVLVEGDMKNGFFVLGVPLRIGILYEGEFQEVFIDADKKKGFSGVPLTVMVTCLNEAFHHPNGFSGEKPCIKTGSLQKFIQNCKRCAVVKENCNFPVEEVHKVAVLDLRLGNADRHVGNILCQRKNDGLCKLIPIDHGYCLPESVRNIEFIVISYK